MAERSLTPVGADLSSDPIARIARAEQARADASPQAQIFDSGPDLVEPSRPLAPQGLSAVVDASLGSVKLPTLLELANALDDVGQHAGLLAEIDPAMSEIVTAVLDDEQRKVLRYVDLRDK
ncbi:MAG: hypothetical protein AAGG57_16300 [Pseudomonadota bacterium]